MWKLRISLLLIVTYKDAFTEAIAEATETPLYFKLSNLTLKNNFYYIIFNNPNQNLLYFAYDTL